MSSDRSLVAKAPQPAVETSAASVPFGRRVTSLDGLRGIAILSVVLFHTLHIKQDYGLFGAIWGRFQNSTWAGVDLFFVLSGFLITGILLDSREYPGYFRNFYARRTLRIFPLYYGVLVVALFAVPLALGLHRLPALYPQLLANQAWLWTYTQNYLQATGTHTLPGFGHFWSLAVEEQFYLFWPLAVFFLPRRTLLYTCLAICAVLPLFRWFLVANGQQTWAIRQYTFTRFDTLLYGAIAALILRDAGLLRSWRRTSVVAAIIAALALIVIAVRDGYVPYESWDGVIIAYSALGILFAVVIAYAVSADSKLNPVLSNSSLRWFGKYSYGIYVFHWPVEQAYRAAIEPRLKGLHSEWALSFCCLAAVLAISSAIALLSWTLFESHFLKLKQFFSYSRTPTCRYEVSAGAVVLRTPARQSARAKDRNSSRRSGQPDS